MTVPPLCPAARPALRAGRASRAVLLALATAWLAIGFVALFHYVDNYWLYRGFPAPTDPPGVPSGTITSVSFRSRALHKTETYDVYLPPGYAAAARAGRRFPVLYLLHPPPGLPNGMLEAGAMTVRADTLLHEHRIRPMILVNPLARTSKFGDDTEWTNTRAGRYDDFMVEVVHSVDHHFATRADRRGRGLSGVSMGGYGAVQIALHHLRMFSLAESWSGYFFQTPTGPFAGASAAELRAASPYFELARHRGALRRLGFRAWLFQGAHDDVPLGQLVAFARRLSAFGGEVRYAEFSGGHDWRLWRGQVVRMLSAASHWFGEPPHAGHGSLWRVAWAA